MPGLLPAWEGEKVEDLKDYVRNWLTEDERRALAYHARSLSNLQTYVLYWHPDPVERERLRLRWLEIAYTLHESGGGSQPPGRPLGERLADAVTKATANPGVIVEAGP